MNKQCIHEWNEMKIKRTNVKIKISLRWICCWFDSYGMPISICLFIFIFVFISSIVGHWNEFISQWFSKRKNSSKRSIVIIVSLQWMRSSAMERSSFGFDKSALTHTSLDTRRCTPKYGTKKYREFVLRWVHVKWTCSASNVRRREYFLFYPMISFQCRTRTHKKWRRDIFFRLPSFICIWKWGCNRRQWTQRTNESTLTLAAEKENTKTYSRQKPTSFQLVTTTSVVAFIQ